MSSFICQECGKEIFDSPTGYTTGCEHWPLEKKCKILKFRNKEQKELDDFRDRVHEDLIKNHIIVKE